MPLRQQPAEPLPSGQIERPALDPTNSPQRQPWLKFAALILTVAALGLPINDLFRYGVLVVATVLVVAGAVAAQARPWLVAMAAVAICLLGQIWLEAPRIEEGHNVFIVDGAKGNAL